MFDVQPKKKTHRKDKELAEINELRSKAGLKLVLNKPRPCMRCKREFISEGAWHRLCWNCSNALDTEGF